DPPFLPPHPRACGVRPRVVRGARRRGRGAAGGDGGHGRAGRGAGVLPDRAGAGRVHAAAHPGARRPPGDRDRHVHRVLRTLHRPRAARRRTAGLPGPQRGVDGGRPPVLGAGGADRPDRPARGGGSSGAAGVAGRGDLRPGLRRRRQDRIRRLRRGAVRPDDAERCGAAGQHVALGASARSAVRRRPRPRRAQRGPRRRRALGDRAAPAGRRPDRPAQAM
ncbi:MAG: Caffeoyl-CoA O-methyltransferase(), partial [uncultured Nocardioides sp.]